MASSSGGETKREVRGIQSLGAFNRQPGVDCKVF